MDPLTQPDHHLVDAPGEPSHLVARANARLDAEIAPADRVGHHTERLHRLEDEQGVKDVRVLIERINQVLRGWGNYFGTGNAAKEFIQVDDYVGRQLRRFLVRRHGRNLVAGQAKTWTDDFFVKTHGLHRLRGTIKYPEAA